MRIKKIILHPGDASIIRTSYVDPNWIMTKSDYNQAYIWNVERHKYSPSHKENVPADTPDITYFF